MTAGYDKMLLSKSDLDEMKEEANCDTDHLVCITRKESSYNSCGEIIIFMVQSTACL